MIVIGIDPAMRGPIGIVAVAWGTPPALLAWRTVTPPKGDAASRLTWLALWLGEQLDRQQAAHPDLAVAYEASWAGKSIQVARKLGLAGGIVIACATARGLPWWEVQPAEGKLALSGDSGAGADVMRFAALRQFEQVLSEHEAHALGVALHAAGHLHRARLTTGAVMAGGIR
jgi:Holliday junction resolvasome RuvABC endonuclease subunit